MLSYDCDELKQKADSDINDKLAYKMARISIADIKDIEENSEEAKNLKHVLTVCKKKKQTQFEYQYLIIKYAVCKNYLSVIEWLWTNYSQYWSKYRHEEYNSLASNCATWVGSIEILEWLLNNNILVANNLCKIAGLSNNISTLEWLQSHDKMNVKHLDIVHICARGKYEAFVWLCEHNANLPALLQISLGICGDIRFVEYMKSRNRKDLYNSDTLYKAAEYDHLDMVKWLVNEQVAWPEPYHIYSNGEAASCWSLETFKWATETMKWNAWGNWNDEVCNLLKKSVTVYDNFTELNRHFDNSHIVEWAHKNGCPCTCNIKL